MRSIFLQFLADLKHFPRPKNAYKDGNFIFRKKNARQEKKTLSSLQENAAVLRVRFSQKHYSFANIFLPQKNL